MSESVMTDAGAPDETIERRRIAVIDGATRHDLVLPTDVTLSQALRAVGIVIRVGRDTLVGPDGAEVSALVRADDLDDGAVLAFIDLAERSPAGRSRRGGTFASGDARSVVPAAWLLGLCGVLAAAASLVAPASIPSPARFALVTVLALLTIAAGLTMSLRAPLDAPAPATAVPVLVAAFAAGAVAVPALPAAGVVVAVLAGLLSASASAGVFAVVAASPALRSALATASTELLIFAGIWALALMSGMDATAAAAISLGLCPVALRGLVATLVNVPPGLFIDYERYQTTRWSVRQKLPEEIDSITNADARSLVARSRARLVAGSVLLCLVAAVAAPYALVPLTAGGPVEASGRIALAASVTLALVLGARRSSTPLLRWLPRTTALVVAIVAILDVSTLALAGGAATLLTVGACVCLAAGAAAGLATIPAGRGRVSLGWSRFGDVIEWIAIALALPAGMLAAGVVDVIRGMMAA